MQIAYHKGFSHHLGRDMEYKRFGHAGRPVVMFPTSRGRFFQYEDTGTIAALADFIEAGRIQIWTLDGIDDETFFGQRPRPAAAHRPARSLFPLHPRGGVSRVARRRRLHPMAGAR